MSEDSSAQRMLPRPRGLSREYYAKLAAGSLCFQRCDDCGAWRQPPRHRCAECSSDHWSWHSSTGRGTVYTWTVVRRPLPAFADEAPFAVVVIELEEGPRIASRLRDVAIDDLELGLPVVLEIERIDDAMAIPWFRRA